MTTTITNASEVSAYFERRLPDVLKLVRALVEAESPSGDAEGSRAVVSLLEAEARTIPAVTSIERLAAREGFGVHLRLRAFGGEGRGTLVVGHTDTVHPRGTLAERPLREEGGRLYGPGVFDM